MSLCLMIWFHFLHSPNALTHSSSSAKKLSHIFPLFHRTQGQMRCNNWTIFMMIEKHFLDLFLFVVFTARGEIVSLLLADSRLLFLRDEKCLGKREVIKFPFFTTLTSECAERNIQKYPSWNLLDKHMKAKSNRRRMEYEADAAMLSTLLPAKIFHFTSTFKLLHHNNCGAKMVLNEKKSSERAGTENQIFSWLNFTDQIFFYSSGFIGFIPDVVAACHSRRLFCFRSSVRLWDLTK